MSFNRMCAGLIALAAFSTAQSATIHVDAGNCPGPGSGTIEDPYCSIQTAIDNAVDTDDVLVAPGTYFEAINFNGLAITVHSSGGAAVTTIDGGGVEPHVVRCVNNETSTTVLDGFTITGGNANGGFPNDRGGGMWNSGSSPTVANCVFSGNMALFGGGMMNQPSSSPTLTNCTFTGNSATEGGGMWSQNNSNPALTDCTFTGNSATSDGGGMFNNDNSTTMTNCLFDGNDAGSDGGGIYCNTSTVMLIDCTIDANEAVRGGGIYLLFSGATISGCTVSSNIGSERGGGMAVFFDPAPIVTDTTFISNTANGVVHASGGGTYTNCMFIGNDAGALGRGGAMYLNSGAAPTLTNCLLVGNTATVPFGDGIDSLTSSPTVTNCTFWAHDAAINNDGGVTTISNSILRGDATQILVPSGTVTATYSNVEGGFAGAGNIDLNPRFVDPDGPDDVPGNADDDLRLADFSPCVDAADNDAVPVGITTDLDVNPRFVDDAAIADTGNAGVPGPPVVDMGPYERQDESVAGITLFVDSGNCPGPGIGTMSDPFCSIQDAIDETISGFDEVELAPGTYNEVINFNGKAITVRSASGDPADTIIDATGIGGTVVDCISGEGPDTVLDGLTITGGTGTLTDLGFGALVMGGGMRNIDSSPTVTRCTFIGNSAADRGGGILNHGGSPTVSDCVLKGNSADLGAGIFNSLSSGGSPTVAGCTFGNPSGGSAGGGIYNQAGSATIIDCTFSHISSEAIFNEASNPSVTDCIFTSNAVCVMGTSSNLPTPLFQGDLTNCTFYDNTVVIGCSGVFNSPSLWNCILWGNGSIASGSCGEISYSNVEGGWAGSGVNNIDSDPMLVISGSTCCSPTGGFGCDDSECQDLVCVNSPFCCSVSWDQICSDAARELCPDLCSLQLSAGSPSIDAGSNAAPGLGGVTEDFDGNPRFKDDPDTDDCLQAPGMCGTPPVIDMGALEFQPPPCPWDCADDDGEVGIGEFLAVLALWGEGHVDEPCDFDGDGEVGIDEFLKVLGFWGPC